MPFHLFVKWTLCESYSFAEADDPQGGGPEPFGCTTNYSFEASLARGHRMSGSTLDAC
jgi:hypothetical protein